VDILAPIEFLGKVKDAILHHHERFDGKGYPGGVAGDQIPLAARILAVVDAYESMITERPYRKAMRREEAIEELMSCSGTQFDPQVVEHFVEIIGKDEFMKQDELSMAVS
jgi:HD-GYP domain-containing protein (c-di-GMP phosphodiesterase class II)